MFYPEYLNKCCDWNEYINMASNYLYIGLSPFAYRMATPYIASILPFELEKSFFIFNLSCSIIAFIFFFLWLKEKSKNIIFPSICLSLWMISPHSPLRETFHNVYVDPAAIALIMIGLFNVEIKNLFIITLISIIGPFFREIVIIIPIYYFFKHKNFYPLIIFTGIFLGILNMVRVRYIENQNYIYSAASSFYMNIKNPFNVPASLWNAFGPIAFVSLLNFKNKDFNFLFFIIMIFVFLGGTNREHFMNWIPVFIPMAILYCMENKKLLFLVSSYLCFLSFNINIANTYQHNTELVQGWLWPQKIVVTIIAILWVRIFTLKEAA